MKGPGNGCLCLCINSCVNVNEQSLAYSHHTDLGKFAYDTDGFYLLTMQCACFATL